MRTCFSGLSLIAMLLLACARGGSSPEGTIARFRENLERGRYREAYRSTSSEYQNRVPFAQFRDQWESRPEERDALIAALSHLEDPTEVVATLSYGDGSELRLVQEGRRWQIAENAFDFYDQSSPRAALRSFIRAMERRRYDVVLHFVPNADRDGMTVEQMQEAWDGDSHEEIDQLLTHLRASQDNMIEEIGNRATMPYGERYTVRFLFEDGLWKIEDPD